MTDFETPTVEHSGLRYKIQFRQVSGVWQQRHVWYPCDNPAYPFANVYRVDPWIKSLPSGPPEHAYSVNDAEATA